MNEESVAWTYELNDRPLSSFIVLSRKGEIRGHFIARSAEEQQQVVELLHKAGVKNVADYSRDSQ